MQVINRDLLENLMLKALIDVNLKSPFSIIKTQTSAVLTVEKKADFIHFYVLLNRNNNGSVHLTAKMYAKNIVK